MGANELNIADMLCSTGYLPPRDKQDIERFERIYRDRAFVLESHVIDADAIFDRVKGENMVRTMKIRPVTTIFDRPGALRVAQNNSDTLDESVADTFNQIIKDK